MALSKLDCPFIGLIPYTEEDSEFFFGRALDQQRILANLFAARLTILYGASGVGKSSVLRAGIVQEVRERIARARAAQEEPEVAVVYFKDWKGDVLAQLRSAIALAFRNLLDQDLVSDLPSALPLDQLLMAIGQRFPGDLLLVLDQFEEYFLYHPNEADGFAIQFAKAVNAPALPASLLVALRDDSVTQLDRFKPLIPNLFANYLRIEHLSGEGAKSAIIEPIHRYNLLPDERKTTPGTFEIEPALLENVIEQVRAGRVIIGQYGQGRVAAAATAAVAVETPYLQLVMTRLWKEEVALGSRTLRLKTLQALGGADAIVKGHLEAALAGLTGAQRDMIASIFPHLVTPSGRKIAHSVASLATWAKVQPAELQPLLEELAGSQKRILAPVAATDGVPGKLEYEIYHDSLGKAVLAWQAAYEASLQRRRYLKIGAGLAAILLLVLGALGIAVWQWRVALSARRTAENARQQAQIAEDEAKAARADAQARLLDNQRLQALADHNQNLANQYASQEQQAKAEVESFRQQAKTLSTSASPPPRKTTPALVVADPGATAQIADLQTRIGTLTKQNQDLEAELKRLKPPPAAPAEPGKPKPIIVVTDGQQPATRSRPLADIATSARDLSGKNPKLSQALLAYVARRSPVGADPDPAIQEAWYSVFGGRQIAFSRRIGRPQGAAFSYDGRYLAVSGDYAWCIIDALANTNPDCFVDSVGAISWSPDLDLLALAGDRSLKVYDPRTRKSTERSQAMVGSIAFGPGGVVAFSLQISHEIQLWNVSNKKESQPPGKLASLGFVVDLAFLPDSKRLAVYSGQSPSITLWRYPEGDEPDRLGFWGPNMVFSQNGNFLATASGKGDGVWSLVTRKQVYSATGDIVSVALNPDGSRIAESGANTRVRIRSIGKEGTVTVPDIGPAVFNANGSTLAVGASDHANLYLANVSENFNLFRTGPPSNITPEQCKQYVGLDSCTQ